MQTAWGPQLRLGCAGSASWAATHKPETEMAQHATLVWPCLLAASRTGIALEVFDILIR